MSHSERQRKRERPVEINMTDLGEPDANLGAAEEERQPDRPDIYAAGTPGGGSASGGLAGTTAGDGAPENADLENAMGNGIADRNGEEEVEGGVPYSGPSGGAVGGTPAGGRASGGNVRHGIAPGGTHRGDSTIGSRDS
jgi:hypothetical protein